MRRRRSASSFARQRIAMISDAGVMSKLDSRVMPFDFPPSPVTIYRKPRSFTSSTRFHNTSFMAKPLSWFWYI